MSDEEEALSLSEMPGEKNKVVKRKLSLDKLLKNKYINYTEEELVQLNDQRKDEIIEIDENNKKLKEELTKTIEKLNLLITSNSDILFQEQKKNMTEIENLEKIFYLRKHDHTLSLKYNTTYKQQYNALKIRAKNIDEEQISKKLINDKNMLEKLKNENIELNKKIQEQQFLNVIQTKEFENLIFKQKSENNIQNYANILNDSSLARLEYHDKIENKKKSVEQLKEQFNNLNEYIKKNKNKITDSDKDAVAITKINTELDLLNKDLSKEVDEIIQNCFNNKTILFQDENININSKTDNNINTKFSLNKSSSVKNLDLYNNSKQLNPLKKMERAQSSLFKLSILNNNNINSNNLNRKKSIDTFNN